MSSDPKLDLHRRLCLLQYFRNLLPLREVFLAGKLHSVRPLSRVWLVDLVLLRADINIAVILLVGFLCSMARLASRPEPVAGIGRLNAPVSQALVAWTRPCRRHRSLRHEPVPGIVLFGPPHI